MVKNSGGIVQAMPLVEGKVNLTTGIHDVESAIHCVADGSVTVEWRAGATADIAMVAGEDYAFVGKVTIASGTFHLA